MSQRIFHISAPVSHNNNHFFTDVKKCFEGPKTKRLIIDFKKNNLPIGPPEQYKVALNQVEKELITAGFVIEKIDKDALDYQYIVVAVKPLKNKTEGSE